MAGERCFRRPAAYRFRNAVAVVSGDRAGEHTPVLLPQVLAALNVRASGVYLDATYGRGGHAGAIVEKLVADGRLLCLDRDPVAVAEARARFAADSRVSVFLAPFSALAACADHIAPGLKFDGILFDLGVSSPQLDDSSRGFSFMQDGPLDMRMTKGVGPTAADIVNGASETELIRIFREFVELETALSAAFERLAPHGRLAVISFHSLEDRIVKQFMRRHASTDPVYAGLPFVPAHAAPKLRLVGKAIQADSEETARNPRARSARLRVAERLIEGLAA